MRKHQNTAACTHDVQFQFRSKLKSFMIEERNSKERCYRNSNTSRPFVPGTLLGDWSLLYLSLAVHCTRSVCVLTAFRASKTFSVSKTTGSDLTPSHFLSHSTVPCVPFTPFTGPPSRALDDTPPYACPAPPSWPFADFPAPTTSRSRLLSSDV